MADNNKKQHKLGVKTFSPIVDNESYAKQVLAIKEGIELGATNIGITSPYGGGKSSLIKTVLGDSSLKERISAVSFSDLDVSKCSATSTRDQIEKSLLQQIFYSLDPDNTRGSRIFHAHDEDKKQGFNFLLKILLFSISVLLIFLSNESETFSNLMRGLGGDDWVLAAEKVRIVSLILGVALCAVSVFLLAGHIKNVIIKTKTVDLELQREKCDYVQKDDSLIGKAFDELVYLLKTSKKDILVFEDIDRCKECNATVFSDLRQLNVSLNGCNEIRETAKRLVFVYCLDDSVFDKEGEMQKFFDLVVPVTPVINYGNCVKVLSDALGKVGELKRCIVDDKDDDTFLPLIANYISDMRVALSAINEYLIVYSHDDAKYGAKKEERKEAKSNLALCFYHNLYPQKFEKLFGQNGEYVDAVKLLETSRENYCKQLKEDLEKLVSKTEIKRPIEIPIKYRYMIEAYLRNNGSGGVKKQDEAISSIQTFKNKDRYVGITFRNDNYNIYSSEIFHHATINDMEKFLGIDFYKEIEMPLLQSEAMSTREYQEISEKLQTMPVNPVAFARKYPEKAFPLKTNEKKSQANQPDDAGEFMKSMIVHGYFDDDLLDRLVLQADRGQEGTTAFVIKALIEKKTDITTMHILRPSEVCRKAQAYYFKDGSMVNADIIEALLNDSDFREKRSNLEDVLKSGDPAIEAKKRRLICCDFDTHKKTVELLLENPNYLVTAINEEHLSSEEINHRLEAAAKIIVKADRALIKKQENLPEVISSIWKRNKIMTSYEVESLKELEPEFEASGISFPSIAFAKDDNNMLDFIISTNAWEMNYENITIIFDFDSLDQGYDNVVKRLASGDCVRPYIKKPKKLAKYLQDHEWLARSCFIHWNPSLEESKKSARKMHDYHEATGQYGVSVDTYSACLEETGVADEIDVKQAKVKKEIFDDNK